MSGPVNYNEAKLRNPPTPRSKQKLVCEVREVIEEKPGTDVRGYLEIVVKPHAVQLHEMSKPGTTPLFWLSQSSKHSCVVYDNRLFALMGTRGVTKKEDVDNSYARRKLIAKILVLLEVNFSKESEEFLLGGVESAIFDRQ